MNNGRIFIQIASYRDPELLPTLRDCIEKAKWPENLVFGICWQHSKSDEWDTLAEFEGDERFRIIDVDYTESKGACWARNQLQQLYQDEEYTLQLDSHHRFVENWDEELIAMYKQLQEKGHKKPLLTSYISSYNPTNDPEGRVTVPWKMNFDRFIPEGAVFFLPAYMDNHKELTEPITARFYSAHFAFTTGDFVKEVPHDPELYFHGEEITIAVRAYTWGYDLFHPHKIIAWHEYTRQGRTKQWDDDNTWGERNKNSHAKVRKLLNIDEECGCGWRFGKYGLGSERSLRDYERYAGILFSKRAVQKYTLDHKPAPNPANAEMTEEEFEASFTRIFKHCINVHANDFTENDYTFCAVIFEDEAGEPIHRKDLDKKELESLLKQYKGTFLNIWREFPVDKQPQKWIVWPHSESKGWGKKIEGTL